MIKGSTDRSIADWTASKIVDIAIPQLTFAKGYSGSFRKLGIYRGGHFNTKDGMHFEISRVT